MKKKTRANVKTRRKGGDRHAAIHGVRGWDECDKGDRNAYKKTQIDIMKAYRCMRHLRARMRVRAWHYASQPRMSTWTWRVVVAAAAGDPRCAAVASKWSLLACWMTMPADSRSDGKKTCWVAGTGAVAKTDSRQTGVVAVSYYLNKLQLLQDY